MMKTENALMDVVVSQQKKISVNLKRHLIVEHFLLIFF